MRTNVKHEDALMTLKHAGITKTPQRLGVLNILLQSKTPLSLNTIKKRLAAKVRFDKVTLYRILSLFKNLGIIREITLRNGVNCFELATKDNPVHPHFNCLNCGMLTCMEPLTFSQSRQLISPKEDCSVDHIEINVSGLCADCRNATKLQKKRN
jgi:Fur family transcriptional regulator, ferric uptake regulator